MMKSLKIIFVQTILIFVCTFARKIGRSVKLTHRDKLMIVNYHNDLRRLVPASDMQAVSWDSDASNKAREWGKNCIFNRPWDDEYGENLYKTYYSKPTRSREVMMDALKEWEGEKQNLFNWNVRCTESETCNYAQLVSAKTDRVGCAMVKCPKMIESKKTTNYDMFFFLCFYLPKVELNKQPFTYGRKCSNCPDGYHCKRKLCRRRGWTKIISTVTSSDNVESAKNLKPPTANIVIREESRPINLANNTSNVILRMPPAELTGRQPSEQSFNTGSSIRERLSRRVKRQSRRYLTYEEWYRRERLRQERELAERRYRQEERRRQQQQLDAYRRRNSEQRPAETRQRRPQRQTESGGITSEEENYLVQAHNLLRGSGMQPLKWSRYLERWAKYVVRCAIEYPGPITTYTNFGKTDNGGNVYNVVYDWGNEGYNVNQKLIFGCRTPSDRERCNHNVIVRNEFLRELACASRNCPNSKRQLTCIYR